MDKTGFRIEIGREQWIITRDPNRQAYLGSSSNRELVTAVKCMSADGAVLPPMVILPGKLDQEDWYTRTAVEDHWLFSVTEMEYSNNELNYKWVQHFDRYSAK